MAPYSVGPIYRVLPVSSGSASLTEPLAGSIPRHVERSMQISRTPLSCSLCRKVYETQPIGGAFNPMRSPASTPHHPTASAFLFLYILCLRSCRLPSVFIRRPCLPSLPEELRNSWVPSLPGSYPSSSLLQTLPPPSRLPSFSRFSRL